MAAGAGRGDLNSKAPAPRSVERASFGKDLKEVNMKANLACCSILALAAALALPAQDASRIVKAAVPFDFTVQGRTLPAGDYVIDQSANGSAMILKCRDRSVSAIVPTNHLQSSAPQAPGQLVFHRYGDQYFLAEVWSPGSWGRQPRTTKTERDLALRYSQ